VRDVARLLDEIAAAKRRLGLAADAYVVSCYEADRDGFWLDRALRPTASRIWWWMAPRSSCRGAIAGAKTGGSTLYKLMGLLQRYVGGERKVWSVRVPAPEMEDGFTAATAAARAGSRSGRSTP
jgi:transposase